MACARAPGGAGAPARHLLSTDLACLRRAGCAVPLDGARGDSLPVRSLRDREYGFKATK